MPDTEAPPRIGSQTSANAAISNIADASKLTIGLVGPLPPPAGGMANQTRQLVSLLGDAGHQLEVVRVNAPYSPAWIAKVKGGRAIARLLPYLLRLWRTAGRVDVMHVMANSGWAWHLFAAPAVWIGRLRGTPVVVNYRGGEAETFLAAQSRLVLPTLRKAAAVVVPSGFLEAVFRRYEVPTVVVRNIIDLARFQANTPRTDGPHIIVTRNLEPIYDVATAIRAFAIVAEKYPSARLTVAGVGPQRVELERLCDDCGVCSRVNFCGQVDNHDIPALYQSADMLFNASLVDNMPISLLEAMASGIPIVSTRAGGIPYLVEDGKTALLVPLRDHTAMAQAALSLLDDRAQVLRMRGAGLAAVKDFTWDKVRPALQAVYLAAAKKARH